MSNQISVKPTPIQRNSRDTAIDLIKLYLEHGYQVNQDESLEDIYARFYSLVRVLDSKGAFELEPMIPEEILNKIYNRA